MASRKHYERPDRLEGPTNDLRRQLVEADDNILILETQLSKQKGHRRALRQQTNAQSSPLLQLPLDILSVIFSVAFPSDDIDTWGDDSPLLLGSICRMMRDVAWATPRLWCAVPVHASERYCLSAVSLLEEWLLRSQQLPILIFVDLATPKDLEASNNMWKIMDLIARCSERWQHFTLRVSFFFNKRFCFFPKHFPKLWTLQMPYLFLDTPALFEHAPVLREVWLHFRTGMILPVHLTHLTMDCLDVHDCSMLLRRHPNLIQCTFTVSPLYFEVGTRSMVRALVLESLNITFEGMDSLAITSFFDHISTPTLCELNLSLGDNMFPHHSLVSFIQRSSCQLVKFAMLNNNNTTEEQLTEFFTYMPFLKELELEIEFGINIINKFILNPIDQLPLTGTLLPNLTLLFLTLRTDASLDYTALVEMVRSRRRLLVEDISTLPEHGHVSQLEDLTILGSPWGRDVPPSRAVLAQLQEFVDEGMNMRYLPRGSGYP